MDSHLKLKYYDILNSIKMIHLKSNILYNIINNDDIKINYNEIKLKYINNKNMFKKIEPNYINSQTHNETDSYLKRRDSYEKLDNKPKKFTPEETDAYLKRREVYKKEKLDNNKHKKFTSEETDAYLKRREVYKKEKLDNKHKFNSSDVNGGNSQIYVFY
jgi:hypothetical protein